MGLLSTMLLRLCDRFLQLYPIPHFHKNRFGLKGGWVGSRQRTVASQGLFFGSARSFCVLHESYVFPYALTLSMSQNYSIVSVASQISYAELVVAVIPKTWIM